MSLFERFFVAGNAIHAYNDIYYCTCTMHVVAEQTLVGGHVCVTCGLIGVGRRSEEGRAVREKARADGRTARASCTRTTERFRFVAGQSLSYFLSLKKSENLAHTIIRTLGKPDETDQISENPKQTDQTLSVNLEKKCIVIVGFPCSLKTTSSS